MTILSTLGKLLAYAAAGVNLLFTTYVILRLCNFVVPRWVVRGWKKFRRFRRRLFRQTKKVLRIARIGLIELSDWWKSKREEVLGIGLVIAVLVLCFIGLIITAPQL